MRHYETKVQELKNNILREVAALTWSGDLERGVLDIPEKIIPGPEPHTRCCIYKERAIVNERVKLAMGGWRLPEATVAVLPIACDECPVTEMTVGSACRGCLATRCVQSCPRDAIQIVNHKAEIDHKKCVMCGRCLSVCPYGAISKNLRPCERGCPANAIHMDEQRKASIDYEKCISCGNCVYQCPFGAIMDRSFMVDVIRLLLGAEAGGYHVWAAVAPSIAGQFPDTSFGQVAAALKAVGFYDVFPVAYGADMTAKVESGELVEKGTLASSCCPAFVAYAEKNFPELAEKLISETPSPMVMAARDIHRRDEHARVVFIGPCVAKKSEFRLEKTGGVVDSALSFEEINAMFEARGVEPKELPEAELTEGSGFGWRFAASGGVAGAVAQAMKEKDIDFDLKPLPCSGIEACRVALLKAGKGVLDANFIEGMACEGGCIMGPVNLVRAPQNKARLEKQAALTLNLRITDSQAD